MLNSEIPTLCRPACNHCLVFKALRISLKGKGKVRPRSLLISNRDGNLKKKKKKKKKKKNNMGQAQGGIDSEIALFSYFMVSSFRCSKFLICITEIVFALGWSRVLRGKVFGTPNRYCPAIFCPDPDRTEK